MLSVLTGAADLGEPYARTAVLTAVAAAEPSLRADYTRVILAVASKAARQALEDMMKTVPWDPFVDGLLDQGRAEGRAEGEARALLRVLAARGFDVPAEVRDRVTSCTDTDQLDTWADRAATANTLSEVFSD